jgi:hypothetical protein
MFRKIMIGIAAALVLALPAFAQEGVSALTTRIAYGYSDALYVMNPGGDTPILVDDAPSYDYSAVWSPDGTKLAYLVSADGQTYSEMRTLKVWDGTQSTEIVSNFKSTPEMPINWTRDGKLLYFVDSGTYTDAGEMLNVSIVDPVAGATPELVSNQVTVAGGCGGGSSIPMQWAASVENGFGSKPFAQLTDYGLIYPSYCAGGRGVLFRTFSNEMMPFSSGRLSDMALSNDQHSLAGLVSDETGDNSLVIVNLETLEETTLATTHSPLQVAWASDGSLYYAATTETGNLLQNLTEEQRRTFSTIALGIPTDMPAEVTMSHNALSVYHVTLDGTETPVFEGLDAYTIGRIQVVGSALYFSTISNGDAWVQGVLDGTLTMENYQTAADLVHTDLYMVDLATPGSAPTLIMSDATQFAAAGQ